MVIILVSASGPPPSFSRMSAVHADPDTGVDRRLAGYVLLLSSLRMNNWINERQQKVFLKQIQRTA